jgi:hypothetical protein
MALSNFAVAAVALGLVSAPAAYAQLKFPQPSVAETAFEYNSYYAPDNGPYYAQNDSRPPDGGPAPADSLAAGNCNTRDSCSSCNDGCGGGFGNFCAACQECPCHGLVLFSGFDWWRGIGDRSSNATAPSNNEGASFGFNYGTRLGQLSDWTGLGFQFGGSYGVYDWNGRPFNLGVLSTTAAQQQVFITTGFFKKANEESPWSYGVVHDWMFNQAWGAFAVNPSLGQWRGQVACAVDACNEFGVWATLRGKGDTNLDNFGSPVFTRPIDQGNLFWHHKWDTWADSWFWVGIPQENRLDQIAGGSLGNFLIGGSVIAPMNDYVSLYANMQYMHPSAAAGSIGSGEASWYVAFGLQYYIGGTARTPTVAGNCWLPYLPVANNGNFLVDALRTLGPI